MPKSEFDLISKYFAAQPVHREDVLVPIGDDGAVISSDVDQSIVMVTDTLVSDVHFPAATQAYDLGYKALAVNLSDLAAMGAQPCWALLAITLPSADENWIADFCAGLFALAKQFNVQLIGGDTTRGPLCITVTAAGKINAQQCLRRNGARVGDDIYVSGTLGEAALALASMNSDCGFTFIQSQDQQKCVERLNRPVPRVALGCALQGIATAAIDVSDGLVGDLGHILQTSGVGARIDVAKLPIFNYRVSNLREEQRLRFGLSGGDDYELCFTAAPSNTHAVELLTHSMSIQLTKIGEIRSKAGILFDREGKSMEFKGLSFDHFK